MRNEKTKKNMLILMGTADVNACRALWALSITADITSGSATRTSPVTIGSYHTNRTRSKYDGGPVVQRLGTAAL